MRLDTRAFSFAGAVVAAAVFTLCAVWVAISPSGATAAFAVLTHLDVSGLSRAVTWGSYFVGLVCWMLGSAVVFGAVASIYNRMLASSMPAAVQPRTTTAPG